jgi:hypothetical protein
LFADTIGVVYIIPETKYLIEVFPAFEVRQREAALSEVSP